MPTLGNVLDFSKYEARNLRAHQLGAAPSSPVTGQLYYNTGDNTLYWWDGTAWQSAKGGVPGAHHLTHEPGGSDPMAVDAAVGTGSLRTLGAGGLQAMPGSRVLSAINAPTASLTLAGQQIVNLADPSGSQDGATKNYVDIQDGLVRGYVDAAVQGLSWKNPVLVVATTPIAGGGAPAGAQTIDGIVLANSDRVLLTAQTSPQFNGIWQVNTTGSWNRVADANSSAELVSAAVYVSKGTANADTAWVCTTDAPITVDTTPLTFAQFSGAAQITAGGGLTKTGNSLDVGAGAGITVNADTIQVANDGITNAMIADGAVNLSGADVTGTLPIAKGGTGAGSPFTARAGLGAAGVYSTATHGAGTSFTILATTHQLNGARTLLVQCLVDATGAVVLPDIVIASNGDVTVTFGVSQSANTIRTTIVG